MSDREIRLLNEIEENQSELSRAQAELERIRILNAIMAAKIAAKKQELQALKDFRDANPPPPGPPAA